jgi:hypothetical protein
LIFKWFGGRHHKPHNMFMAHSRKCNEGRPVGLMRPVDTRMAGYWIALTRLLRLEPVFDSLFGDPNFKNTPVKEKPPNALIAILRQKQSLGIPLSLSACYVHHSMPFASC